MPGNEDVKHAPSGRRTLSLKKEQGVLHQTPLKSTPRRSRASTPVFGRSDIPFDQLGESRSIQRQPGGPVLFI